jgi:hypothetical protein
MNDTTQVQDGQWVEIEDDGAIIAMHSCETGTPNRQIFKLNTEVPSFNDVYNADTEEFDKPEPVEVEEYVEPTLSKYSRLASEAINAKYPTYKQLNTIADFGLDSEEYLTMTDWIKAIRDWSNDENSTREQFESLTS